MPSNGIGAITFAHISYDTNFTKLQELTTTNITNFDTNNILHTTYNTNLIILVCIYVGQVVDVPESGQGSAVLAQNVGSPPSRAALSLHNSLNFFHKGQISMSCLN